ncbi:hypothetical protein Poly30_21840 [Planctomycetes bacterium Poly30]|uniref:Uncharacterized protein n=1 Tax=Saltatorellus ferox TaxID=2528018 RepID=A0A518ERF2_9BACT|nr:hypothetical protein Poly30_21840 [Planctomycetes bacterium Poly30]
MVFSSIQKARACALTLALTASAASAQVTLDLAAVSNAGATAGDSTVYALPGDVVAYAVTGQLGGEANQGLAMFAFDLSFSGGALTQASAPASGALAQFVSPLGFNNPEGFGGTVRGGDLLQVGGAMNTIANMFAPSPSGTVTTGIASGMPEVLATGSLTAPTAPGTYQLTLANPFANALNTLQPAGFWSVKPVEPADPSPLTLVVLDCGISNYCTGKLNSAGCVPAINAVGSASISGGSTVTLTAQDVVNGQTGLFVWSLEADSVPLYGGTLCVGQPLFRMLEPTTSGGAGMPGTSCGGSFARTIDAAFISGAGLVLGDTVHAQWIYRDPSNADGTGAGLTDGVRFTVCP